MKECVLDVVADMMKAGLGSFAYRVARAAERDRDAMKSAWEPGSTANVVRMMEDEAFDLMNVRPDTSEVLRYYVRELKSTHTSTPCNGAAMWAALQKILKKESTLVGRSLVGNKDAQELLSAITIAHDTLEAPARNCDLFGGDYKMLHTAWHDWAGSPSGMNANGTAKLTFGKWLLAQANKKVGAE